MKAQSVTQLVSQRPNNQFRLGVLAPNSPHILAAAFWAYGVHRISMLQLWQTRFHEGVEEVVTHALDLPLFAEPIQFLNRRIWKEFRLHGSDTARGSLLPLQFPCRHLLPQSPSGWGQEAQDRKTFAFGTIRS